MRERTSHWNFLRLPIEYGILIRKISLFLKLFVHSTTNILHLLILLLLVLPIPYHLSIFIFLFIVCNFIFKRKSFSRRLHSKKIRITDTVFFYYVDFCAVFCCLWLYSMLMFFSFFGMQSSAEGFPFEDEITHNE